MDILIHLLHLVSLRFKHSVGRNQSVRTRVQFRFLILQPAATAHLSVIGPVCTAILCLRLESLVHEVPDKSPLHVRAVVNHLPQVFDISVAVSLRMRILTHDVGTRLAGIAVFLHPAKAGIHGTYHVRIPVFPCLLKLHEAVGVVRLQALVLIVEHFSVAALITQ